MKKTVFLFDLDGTLLDTLEDLTAATNYILQKHGEPLMTAGQVRQILGNGAHHQLRCALPAVPEEVLQQYVAEYKAYYQAHCREKTRLYEGVAPLLERLQQKGCRIAILSNKPHETAETLCRHYFPGVPVQGQLPGVPRKPAPEGVWHMMEQLGAHREETVYVGDSEVDLATADHAGIDSILVTWGFRSREQLCRAGAKHLADTPQEVEEMF